MAVGGGQGAVASGDNSVALGQGAQALATNSVAIGTGSLASQANTVSLGAPGAERRLVNVAPGIGPTDAVNLQQFNSGLNSVRREARQGVAATTSLAGTPMPSAAGRTAWSVNTATFKGEFGVGAALAHRLDLAVPLALTGGVSYGGSSSIVARVGLQGEF